MSTTINNRWLSLLVICFGGGIIYIIPYLQFSYYDPIKEGLDISHSQMGDLMSILGITSSICYLLGGVAADKFSVRYLLTIAFFGTGTLGLWMASFPSYSQMVVIMFLFAIMTILLYWPAMIKAIKLLANDGEYGKMFGFREAGFGLFGLIFTQVGAWFIFNNTGNTVEGARNIIIFFSAICFIAAVFSFILIPHSEVTKKTDTSEPKEAITQHILETIKIPAVWFMGLTIFCLYTVYSPGIGKFGPYFTGVLQFDDTTAASLTSFRMYLVQLIAASLAGILADKMSSIVKFVMISTVCLIVTLTMFVLTPVTPAYLGFTVVIVFIISAIMYSLTGTYMAPISELGIPNKYLGTAIGIISFIAYLPDAFMWSVFGRMLGDNPQAAEYHAIFIVCIGFAIAAFCFAWLTYKSIKKASDFEVPNDPRNVV